MGERRYSKEHEWVWIEGEIATVGLSDHAQEQLGDVVYVELPEIGARLDRRSQAATVESVKAASEVYAPVSGEVTAANGKLAEAPELVNSDPLGEGWFFKLRVRDTGEFGDLMDEPAYQDYVKGLD